MCHGADQKDRGSGVKSHARFLTHAYWHFRTKPVTVEPGLGNRK